MNVRLKPFRRLEKAVAIIEKKGVAFKATPFIVSRNLDTMSRR